MSSIVKGVQDPLFNLNYQLAQPVLRSADNVAYTVVNSSSHSASSTQFNIQQDQSSLMSRRIKLKCTVAITATKNAASGTGTAALTIPAERSGFRAYPLQGSMSRVNFSLNNHSTSVPMASVARSLTKFGFMDEQHGKLFASTSTSLHDVYQSVSNGDGQNNNPLSSYGTSGGVVKRTSIRPIGTVVNTDAAFSATYEITETLLLPGCQFNAKSDSSAFAHIRNFDLNIQWESALFNKMWQHHAVLAADDLLTYSAVITEPKLLIKTVQPNAAMMIPKIASYPWYRIDPHETNTNVSVAPGAETSIITSQIGLSGIPERIYIWAGRSASDLASSHENTDTFMGIESLSINFNGRNGLLSSCQPEDLYLMSVQNGLNDSFQNFRGSVYDYATNAYVGLSGSVICIKPGINFELPPSTSVGLTGRYSITVTATVKNNHGADTFVNPRLVVEPLYEGIMKTSRNTTQSAINTVIPQDIQRAQISSSSGSSNAIQGGGFFSDFVKGFDQGVNGVFGVVDKGLDVAKKGKKLAKKAVDIGFGGIEVGGRSCDPSDVMRAFRGL